jgi:putative SOS response-associated peptidase YedK
MAPIKVLATLFDFEDGPELPPRYNIAPTQPVAAVRLATPPSPPCEGGAGGVPARELALLRWGLIPAWADDLKIGYRLINARSETAATKPAFRSAFRQRRCLIPADGFYEWQKLGKEKQPFYIHRRDGQPLAFAGLWEHWHGAEQDRIESCTILTTTANDLLQSLHDRMPVVLSPKDYARWLDPKTPKDDLEQLLKPAPLEVLTSYPVSRWVNDVKHDDAKCVEAVPGEPAA